jgi:hypothetical protein
MGGLAVDGPAMGWSSPSAPAGEGIEGERVTGLGRRRGDIEMHALFIGSGVHDNDDDDGGYEEHPTSQRGPAMVVVDFAEEERGHLRARCIELAGDPPTGPNNRHPSVEGSS